MGTTVAFFQGRIHPSFLQKSPLIRAHASELRTDTCRPEAEKGKLHLLLGPRKHRISEVSWTGLGMWDAASLTRDVSRLLGLLAIHL